MVSKLLLATQETYFRALKEGADIVYTSKIKDHYYEIKAGIGLYKSPDLYGAFPTDAYSHTPENGGVKQPGLTGQVKEDVISRLGELGVRIENGAINFDSTLLNKDEILTKNAEFEYYSLKGEKMQLRLKAGQIALTLCQVPVVYNFSDLNQISIKLRNGNNIEFQCNSIDKDLSSSIFSREGEIELIEVSIKNSQ